MTSIKLSFNVPKPKKITTVYIIEDNDFERNMLVDFFEKYPNITVTGFSNGDECIKNIVISKSSPNLILLDYFLDSTVSTSKDGLEILAKLKELSPASDFIMYTSIDNERIIELARKKGIIGYVIKGEKSYENLDSVLRSNYSFEESEEKEE